MRVVLMSAIAATFSVSIVMPLPLAAQEGIGYEDIGTSGDDSAPGNGVGAGLPELPARPTRAILPSNPADENSPLTQRSFESFTAGVDFSGLKAREVAAMYLLLSDLAAGRKHDALEVTEA